MKKKDIELFNKAIHNLKRIINEIKEERDNHHKKMNKLIKEQLEVLNEVYELFDDLYGA